MSDYYVSQFKLEAQEYVTGVIALMEPECAVVKHILSTLSRLMEGEYFAVRIVFEALKRCHRRRPSNQNAMQVDVRVDEPLSRFLYAVLVCDHFKATQNPQNIFF